ncbi:MAG TPA: penicillin acylase family protein [Parvularculaceae bacterium]|nr:penicillin acylase family protein [Parvularculaceae bacterium]
MKIIRLALAALALLLIVAGFWLRTPHQPFDAAAAKKTASAYDARIIRDKFGVPHIYGKRDADVAFGLAYAHAEDDWATLEDVLRFSRGRLGEKTGKAGAVTDYLIAALHVWPDIDTKYEKDLSPETRALVEGYAAGINLWCADHKGGCAPGVAPVTGKDIVAGFAARTPFFYSLDEALTDLFKAAPETHAALEQARVALLHLPPSVEIGSNAQALSPARSADGHTRLMVNSHQPWTGPVAWYEARLKSDEGIDMIGGLFPGAPLILHGTGPKLGWAFTVSKPDLVDIYRLEVDDPKNPTKYRYDGGWKDFERSTAKFRVKLFGPFSLPVEKTVLRAVQGPAFVTPNGVFAVAYAGQGDIRTVEQWYRLDRATDFDSWKAAMSMQAIPSFNVIYADATGTIAYYYNESVPVRSDKQDWSKIADGSRPDLVWQGTRPFGSTPHVIRPTSGYVVSSNHSPYLASGAADNPSPDDYPASYGIDQRSTNRALRIQALYSANPSITSDEFVAYKMDDRYAPNSRLGVLISNLLADPDANADPDLKAPLEILRSWDYSAAKESRGAALAIRTARLALGPLLDGVGAETPDSKTALKQAAGELKKLFGRIDPEWGETMRLKRGSVDLPVDGAPDTLRAVYPEDASSHGVWVGGGGESYILYSDWAPDGAQTIKTIHQFGAATQDKSSPHYADQAPLFAAKEWKSPPMTLDALLAEATADARLGKYGSDAVQN